MQELRVCLSRSVKRAMARDKVERNVVELTEVPTGQPGRRWKSLSALANLCVDAPRIQRVQQAEDRLAAGERWTETGLVFTTRLGTGMVAANLRRDLRRALALVPGLNPTDWTPRELRLSFVSLLSDAGVPLGDIAQLVGHRASWSRTGVCQRLVLQQDSGSVDGRRSAVASRPDR